MYQSREYPRDKDGTALVKLLNEMEAEGFVYVETIQPKPGKAARYCIFRHTGEKAPNLAALPVAKSTGPVMPVVAEKPQVERNEAGKVVLVEATDEEKPAVEIPEAVKPPKNTKPKKARKARKAKKG